MKTFVIVNPSSGNGKTGERWPKVEVALKKAIGPFTAALTKKEGDATKLAQKALEEKCGRLIVYGGDGTINEVVNGLFEGKHPIKFGIQLGVIPAGTGGDFRKSLGLSPKVSLALDVIARGHTEVIDVGRVKFEANNGNTEERHFANMTGIGLSGDVMRKVNKARTSKSFGAAFAFKFATLTSMIGSKNRMVRIEVDNYKPLYEMACSVHICNGRYAGGGMMFAPTAELNDGKLDIVLLGDFKVFNLLVESRALYSGEHVKNPMVQTYQGKEIRVSSDENVFLEVDGETPGVLPATFEVIPSSLTVICPPNFGRACEKEDAKKNGKGNKSTAKPKTKVR